MATPTSPSLTMSYKTQRSRSFSNEIEPGPKCNVVVICHRQRKLSFGSTNDSKSLSVNRHRVAKLCEYFESSNSTESVQPKTNNKRPSQIAQTDKTAPTFPNNSSTEQLIQMKSITATRAKFVKAPMPISRSNELMNETSIHSPHHYVYDSDQSNRYNNHAISLTDSSRLENSMSNTASSCPSVDPPQRPFPVIGKYIISQSEDQIPGVTDDSCISSHRNSIGGDSSDVSSTSTEKDGLIARPTNLFKCLEEIYITEKNYVKVLYVLSSKISAEVKTTCGKEENLVTMFHNIYQPLLITIQRIYIYHHETVLPQMEEYVTGFRKGNVWSIFDGNSRIIENLYKAYYIAYDESQRKLETLCKTHPLIDKAMLNIQVHLDNLYPITQLNCANQRLLRYILLMKAYMKNLDETSAEYEHTSSLRDELDRIAVRCEEQLVLSPTQLNDLKARFDNKPDGFKHQQLLWHGSLKKQSPRKHAVIVRRYIILFSDRILVCRESGRKLDINRELLLKDITIDIIDSRRIASTTPYSTNEQQLGAIVYYSFRVNAIEKSYEFLVDKESDREKWVTKIRQANEAFQKRIPTIEIRKSSNHPDVQQRGIRAPAWVNDNDVTRCQNCNNRFRSNLISSRQHHCRSCGHCICSSCSSNKLILEYCKNQGEVRVCDTCNTYFTGKIVVKTSISSPPITRDPNKIILFGDFLFVSSHTTVWIALEEDKQLHIYGGKLDQTEDYSINLPDLRELSYIRETRTFTFNETNKTYTFSMELNHQTDFQKNDYINEKIKHSKNKLLFYADLWHEAMQSARSKTVPLWYIRKRDSADSGISAIE